MESYHVDRSIGDLLWYHLHVSFAKWCHLRTRPNGNGAKVSPIEMAQLVDVRIGDQCVCDAFDITRRFRAFGKVILNLALHPPLAQNSMFILTLKPFNDTD